MCGLIEDREQQGKDISDVLASYHLDGGGYSYYGDEDDDDQYYEQQEEYPEDDDYGDE